MGSTWEVLGFRPDTDFIELYRGESWMRAVATAWYYRKKYGYIRIDWRPAQ